MDPGDNDEPSREELAARVEELEANQAEQREWWEDALPSRRGVLTAGAGLGLGALLSGSASGQASNDTSAGQVGVAGSPEDVVIDQLRDPGGDEVLNVDDTGAINAQGREWAFESVNTEDARSDSLPDIRVYHVGGDVVAVEDQTEIARGTDAATIIQAAIDQANTAYDSAEKHEPVRKVTGGMRAFALSSAITVKPGCILDGFRFEASGVGSGHAVQFGVSGATVLQGAVDARDIVVRDAGANAYLFTDVAHCHFENLHAETPTDRGFEFRSVIGCSFDQLHSKGAGLFAFDCRQTGNTGAFTNVNVFQACRAHNSTQTGLRIVSDMSGNLFLGFVAESNGNQGVLMDSTSNARNNTFVSPWLESNGDDGMFLQSEGTTVAYPEMSQNDGGGVNLGLNIGATDVNVVGPIRSSSDDDLIRLQSGATDCTLQNVDTTRYLEVDNGTRTLIDGVGENGGDPNSTGQWNGNGREGIVVVDTTNSATYHYRGGGWV